MTAIPPPKSSPRPSWKKEFFQFFGSVKLVIFLLLIIAAASTIGTVLPQDQGPSLITESSFNPVLKQVLLTIQAYDVYHTFWFTFLLATLFLNLAVCTYLRFPPTWRRYAMETPATPPVQALQEAAWVGSAPTARQLDMLRKRGYRLTELKDGEYFAEKGKFFRLGPTIIHLSLFAIIAGAIVGGLTGMKTSFGIAPGQVISSTQIYDNASVRGRWSTPPAPFDLRLDGFRMDFHPNGTVKLYRSDLTVIPHDGTPPYHKILTVNDPLIQGGQYVYQSFWGIGAVTFSLDGQKQTLALTQPPKVNGYVSRPFNVGKDRFVLFVRDLNQPAVVIQTGTFKPLGETVPGMKTTLAGHDFRIVEYTLYSGLQTKKDPGIPVVYVGCGLLIWGLAMVPFSHRELWVRRMEQGWALAGRTHKGRLMLRKEIESLATLWGDAPHAQPLEQLGAQAS